MPKIEMDSVKLKKVLTEVQEIVDYVQFEEIDDTKLQHAYELLEKMIINVERLEDGLEEINE